MRDTLQRRTTTAALALAGVLTAVGQAHAYCRLTTEQALTSRCPDVCNMEGTPLAWMSDAVYTFNEAFIPDMSEADVRRIYETSFGQWTMTDCTDGPVDVSVSQDPQTTSVTEVIKDDGLSVMVYRSPEQWRSLHPGSSTAFALTIVAFDVHTGELVGADMELNGGIGTFTECPDDGCEQGDSVDLANVVTHEAGHFLGLAHSDVEGSTMYCDAQGWQVDKRTLEVDDIEGICAIYGGLPPDAGGSGSPGCGAATAGSAPAGGLPWLLACGLLFGRRRWLRRA